MKFIIKRITYKPLFGSPEYNITTRLQHINYFETILHYFHYQLIPCIPYLLHHHNDTIRPLNYTNIFISRKNRSLIMKSTIISATTIIPNRIPRIFKISAPPSNPIKVHRGKKKPTLHLHRIKSHRFYGFSVRFPPHSANLRSPALARFEIHYISDLKSESRKRCSLTGGRAHTKSGCS